jgi:hypothetical protein
MKPIPVVVHKWEESKYYSFSSGASTVSSCISKKKVFFEVVNLEAVHMSKHIGFGAPLLAVE